MIKLNLKKMILKGFYLFFLFVKAIIMIVFNQIIDKKIKILIINNFVTMILGVIRYFTL